MPGYNARPFIPQTRSQCRATTALALLVGSNGCPEALILAHGFDVKLIKMLIGAGLIAADTPPHTRWRSCYNGVTPTDHNAGRQGL
jgi:hypothetical protein